MRLARVDLRRGGDMAELASQMDVTDLPDVRVIRNNRAMVYQAGASVADIVDVARWNAGQWYKTATAVESIAHRLHRPNCTLPPPYSLTAFACLHL